MAINSNYYIDAATLDLATSVYLDLTLTNIAPDGFYGDGSITREQSGGILLADEACVSPCPTLCGSAFAGSGATGIYQVNVSAGSGIGAMRIMFDPIYVPDGIRVTYDGVVYNKLSSAADGVHQSTVSGNFTVVGRAADDCGIAGTTYPALPEYLYNESTSSFVATGLTQSITFNSGDVSFSTGGPGNCIMIIPKTAATPSNVFVEMVGPCTTTGFTFSIDCPTVLPSFGSSNVFAVASIPCATPTPNTYYFAKVHTATNTYVGLYDYVFMDANGEFPLADGYYICNNTGVANNVIHVVNGVVVAFSLCS